MTDYYGHHPSPIVADPGDYYDKGEVLTISANASANALIQANTYSDTASAHAYSKAQDYADAGDAATLSSANTYSDAASAHALDLANNGWWKENFTMTTTTTAASGRPIGIIFDDHSLFVKVHVAAVEVPMAPSGDSGGFHIEGVFYKGGPGPATPGTQIGSTVVVAENKTNPNWDVDFQLMGIDNEVVEVVVTGDAGQLVKWSITVEWLLGTPY